MIKRYYQCENCGFECWGEDLGTKLEFHSEVHACEELVCCPECGSEEIYETDPPPALWKCLSCGKEFTEDEVEDEYKCPCCGSENVKEV